MSEIKFDIRLRELRAERELKQKHLADLLSVHISSISDWEARGRRPSYETLYRIAQIFDVTVGYLLGVED